MGRAGIEETRGWNSPEGYPPQPGGQAGLPEGEGIRPFESLPDVSLQKESLHRPWPSPQELASPFSRVGFVRPSVFLFLSSLLPSFVPSFRNCSWRLEPSSVPLLPLTHSHPLGLSSHIPSGCSALNTLGYHFLGTELHVAPPPDCEPQEDRAEGCCVLREARNRAPALMGLRLKLGRWIISTQNKKSHGLADGSGEK